ncbi:MAG TPA: pseudouridine-5'-phosphate glycosidase [Anaerolineae bacterium]|nr:pseudouridine-5'-phosphate glycosidase [Anaerolineae bacterium]
MNMKLSEIIDDAIKKNKPIVALESTVFTHGLPYPRNFKTALQLERVVRKTHAIPATIGIVNGCIHIGLSESEIETLAKSEHLRKISKRDFGIAIGKGLSGGTTVAGTITVANLVGIKVFATGGIGGVHRNAPFDISADLNTLANTPMIVVCAGAKAILDLPATIEYLETFGIPILGYQTNEFPAFYSSKSGLPIDIRVNSVTEVIKIAKAHWQIGLNSAILVTVPPPEEHAMPFDVANEAIKNALQDAVDNGIRGAAVTPFLLQRVSELTGSKSLQANLSLLENNARIAAEISLELSN